MSPRWLFLSFRSYNGRGSICHIIMTPQAAFLHRISAVAAVSLKPLLLAAILTLPVLIIPYLPVLASVPLSNKPNTDVEVEFSDTIHRIAPIPAMAIPVAAPLVREVHVANNGLVLLRGARVLSISGLYMRVAMVWGVMDFTWMVLTDEKTKFLTREGLERSPEEIRVGDIVTVTGTLGKKGSKPTIHAKVIRDAQE